jgi:5-methylthioribose kinase
VTAAMCDMSNTLVFSFFFLYNNYNNYIINNKSDKIKFEIYKWQRVTSSGAGQTCH